MSYRLISVEVHGGKAWPFTLSEYRTFRCAFCSARAVTVDNPSPPKECGKCRR